MQQYSIDAEGGRRPDRRTEHYLREVFERAYDVLSPFMDPKNSWGGQVTGRLAYHAVRDWIPELPPEAARILVEVCLKRGLGREEGPGALLRRH